MKDRGYVSQVSDRMIIRILININRINEIWGNRNREIITVVENKDKDIMYSNDRNNSDVIMNHIGNNDAKNRNKKTTTKSLILINSLSPPM